MRIRSAFASIVACIVTLFAVFITPASAGDYYYGGGGYYGPRYGYYGGGPVYYGGGPYYGYGGGYYGGYRSGVPYYRGHPNAGW